MGHVPQASLGQNTKLSHNLVAKTTKGIHSNKQTRAKNQKVLAQKSGSHSVHWVCVQGQPLGIDTK